MSAIISSCGLYRWRLERSISIFDQLVIAYFGINPSTANASIDDQTVAKWIGFSERMRAGRFIAGNVFGYRAKNVKELAKVADPVGLLNDAHLVAIIAEADILIPCWGDRSKVPASLHHHIDRTLGLILNSGKPVKTFGLTAGGDPKHPQMLGYNTELVDYERAA